MSNISLEFPDGSKQEVAAGIKPAEVAASIGNSLKKSAVAAKINGFLVDLQRPIFQDAKIEIITSKDAAAVEVMRETAIFLLSAVLKQKYPEINFGEHQVNDEGFYLDTDKADAQVSVDELEDLKDRMQKLIAEKPEIERQMMDKKNWQKKCRLILINLL